MFTGLVEEIGRVRRLDPVGDGMRIVIDAQEVLADASIGSSIAVNGCCLTVVEHGDGWWAADAVPETLDRTNLGRLGAGSPVNLERPLLASGRFGGHIVQGHVDTTTTVVGIEELADGSWRVTFALPDGHGRYIAEKGSVALDGTSLTVAGVHEDTFEVAVIPHTREATVIGRYRPGTQVNVEVDIIAKYTERLIRESA